MYQLHGGFDFWKRATMLIEKRPNINSQWPLRQHAHKRAPFYRKAKACTIALLCVVSISTLAEGAQSAAPPINIDDVYRIELIVFADAYATIGDSSLEEETQPIEHWQHNEPLSYPENLIFLRDVIIPPIADTLNTDLVNSDLVNPESLNADGINIDILQNSSPLPVSVSGVNGEANIELTDSTADVTTNNGTEANPNLVADVALNPIESGPEIPPLLIKLEVSKSGLAQIAKTLDRRSQYRVLFYEAWNQALTDRRQAPAMPLNGGMPYGDFYELSGTVTLSKERFLHITTDLWLSEFAYRNPMADSQPWYVAANQDQQLPAPPIPPELPALTENSDSPEETLALTQPTLALLGNSPAHENPEPALDFSDEPPINAGPQRPDYVVKRTALLQEYRRLRRDEVHYLDHPFFGAIVMISKYEEPLNQDEINE